MAFKVRFSYKSTCFYSPILLTLTDNLDLRFFSKVKK